MQEKKEMKEKQETLESYGFGLAEKDEEGDERYERLRKSSICK